MNKKFYTYLWLRIDGTPYYVGKGCAGAAHVRRAFRKGCPPVDRIIIQEHESEEEAFEAERFLIAYYGRLDLGTGCLRNLTNGGEGMSGYKPTEEVLQRWSAMRKGRVFSASHLQNLSIAAKKRSPEHLRKISESLKGKTGTNLGRKFSEEHRRKIGEKVHLASIRRKIVA